jgi:Zn-dependent M32 family carboxypeptidase
VQFVLFNPQEMSNLAGISGLLGWDELVMMPAGAAASRAAQKATLAGKDCMPLFPHPCTSIILIHVLVSSSFMH